ncbi:MAG: hypothetical protein GX984_04710 [Erysipelothrix sp.]|nr:hypothetical protein [Erysipelothrix sp.]
MFYIQSPMKRDFFIELLNGQTIDEVTFKLEKEEGMKLFFSYEGDVNLDRAIRVAKDHIKTTDYGKVLYYIVMPVE